MCSGKPVSFQAMCTKLTRHLLLAPAPSNPNSAPYVLAPMRHVAPLPPCFAPCTPCAMLLPMRRAAPRVPHAPRCSPCTMLCHLRFCNLLAPHLPPLNILRPRHPAACYLYIPMHTDMYLHIRTLHPLPHFAPRVWLTFRLEEQLAKTTLAAENARGPRAYGSKRGRSPSLSPESRGRQNRQYTNRSTRRGRRSPSTARQPKSDSPPRDTKRRRTMKSTADTQQSFRAGAGGNGVLSACTICLGRHPHDVYNCTSATLWDSSPARCQRNGQGRLVNPAGSILCSDWQRPNGCPSTSHDSRHECSGCGKQTHGAQNCPRAQKA